MKDLYSIWLVPQEEDERYLKNIIDDLSLKNDTPSFIPHLTLLGDLRNDPQDLIKIVNEIFENFEEFEVEKISLDYSSMFTKTVFIKVRLDEKLKNLFNNVSSKTDNRSLHIFMPHISLIYKNMPELDKLAIIQNLDIKDKFRIGKAVVVNNKKKTETETDVENWQVIYQKNLNQ